MNLLPAALLGAVQGVTEFLPVSSTAHLLLAERWIGFDDPGGVFTVTIQFGSILAVMWLYRARLLHVVTGLPSDAGARRFAVMLFGAFLPAVVAGLLFSSFIKRVLYASPLVIAVAFVVGGIVMLLVEMFRPRPRVLTVDEISLPRAVGIGAYQSLALVPGVSRSGSTIVGGLLLGLDRAVAAEFSFLLAIPTMAAAAGHELWQVRHQLTPERGAEIAVGFVMAFVASALVIGPFLSFVRRSGFAPFAWYRIVAGLALLGLLASGWR